MNGAAERRVHLRAGDHECVVVGAYTRQGFTLAIDGVAMPVSVQQLGAGAMRVDMDGRRLTATVISAGEKRHVFIDGMSFVFAVVDPLFHVASSGGAEGGLTAPMPGKVIALIATAGQTVEKGAPLLILEAMKMEHTIAAPVAGIVKSFRFAVGEQVGDGAELVEFVPN